MGGPANLFPSGNGRAAARAIRDLLARSGRGRSIALPPLAMRTAITPPTSAALRLAGCIGMSPPVRPARTELSTVPSLPAWPEPGPNSTARATAIRTVSDSTAALTPRIGPTTALRPPLGPVEMTVGARQQRLAVCYLRHRRPPDRYRHLGCGSPAGSVGVRAGVRLPGWRRRRRHRQQGANSSPPDGRQRSPLPAGSPHATLQAQGEIAGGMSPAVVHLLGVVDIEHRHRHSAPGTTARRRAE